MFTILDFKRSDDITKIYFFFLERMLQGIYFLVVESKVLVRKRVRQIVPSKHVIPVWRAGNEINTNKQNILRIYLGFVQKLVQPSDGANKKEISSLLKAKPQKHLYFFQISWVR